MTTLRMPSAVYRQNDTNSSFNDLKSESNQINNSHQSHQANFTNSINYHVSKLNSCGGQSLNIPTVNLNAAISSSLKLNKGFQDFSKTEHYSADLVGRNIAFHRSPATPLDTIIKTCIEVMPNSLILTNAKAENNGVTSEDEKPLLFSDTDLLDCCQKAQCSLPRSNLGLRNAGNTCYLNSVLQCLLATGSLLNYVGEKHNQPRSCAYANGKTMRRFCALCAMYKLLQEHSMNSQVGQSIQTENGGMFSRNNFESTTPSSFVANVRAICPNLRSYQQEDAHEFLLGVLSRMEDSVLAAHGRVPRSSVETNVIRRIFGGTTRSEVTCNTCRKVSPRNDSWFNLSLDITHARSLQQCLINYTQPEILHNANAYKCEICNKLCHASRCCHIYRAPPVLIVQFNRFSRNHKLDTRIDFPASFNMRPFMVPTHGPVVIYNLFATLNHEGFTCRSGHYVAFTKRRNQWFSHNDSCVTSTTQEYVLRQSPYLLFYALASPELVISGRSEPINGTITNGNVVAPYKPLTIRPQLPNISKSSPLIPPASNPSSSNSFDIASIPLPATPTALASTQPAVVFQPRVLCKPLPLDKVNHKVPTVVNGVKSAIAIPTVNTDDPSMLLSVLSSSSTTANPTIPRPLPLTPIPILLTSPKKPDSSPTATSSTSSTLKLSSTGASAIDKCYTRSRSSSTSSDDSSDTSSSGIVWIPVTKTDLEAPTPIRKRRIEEAAAEYDSKSDRKKSRKERRKRKERHRRNAKHKNRRHRKEKH